MAARKFSEVQIELLEKEYNAGLNSVSVKKVGDRIKHLAERTGLEEATVKTWINNRKRGPPPTCFPSPSTMSNEEPSKAKKALRLPSVSRQPSGYNLFAGDLFSNGDVKYILQLFRARDCSLFTEGLVPTFINGKPSYLTLILYWHILAQSEKFFQPTNVSSVPTPLNNEQSLLPDIGLLATCVHSLTI